MSQQQDAAQEYYTQLLQEAIEFLANPVGDCQALFIASVKADGSIMLHERNMTGDKLSTTSVISGHMAWARMTQQAQAPAISQETKQ